MHTALGPGAEFDLIRAFLRRAPGTEAPLPAQVRVGPGDDCAVVRAGALAVSVDMAVEGVHFRRDWVTAEEIGYRSVAAALSDLAAMAATPVGILISLAVPEADLEEFILKVMAGAGEAASAVGTMVIGGDVTRTTGPLVLDVVVLGDAERPVLRRGARTGDQLWVTGVLGGAAAAVHAWEQQRPPAADARRAYARPVPRIAEAAWLARRGALHALIDLSDGLAGDAGHLAAASGVSIVLDAASIPVHPAVHVVAADGDAAIRMALSGGEDYELCLASPADAIEPLAAEFDAEFGLQLTRVGEIGEGNGVALRALDGRVRALDFSGYDHFSTGSS